MNWCTIESDPAVFNALVKQIGVEGVQFEEVYGLDEVSLSCLNPCIGLIFLFQWRPVRDTRQIVPPDSVPGLFFARQTVNNACATQAIINTLMNRADVALGPTLSTLREFSAEMTPTMIGDLIGDFEPIRIAHNSFTAPDPFLLSGEPSTVKDGDEVYHFVAYVPIGDKVYELDGLKSGPIEVGTLPRPISEMEAAGEAWTHVAARGIEARVAMAQQALASHYALMAITPSRRQVIERELQIGEQAEDSVKVAQLHLELEDLQTKEEEDAKENARRKHDYTPFVFELLRSLAKNGVLENVIKSVEQ